MQILAEEANSYFSILGKQRGSPINLKRPYDNKREFHYTKMNTRRRDYDGHQTHNSLLFMSANNKNPLTPSSPPTAGPNACFILVTRNKSFVFTGDI